MKRRTSLRVVAAVLCVVVASASFADALVPEASHGVVTLPDGRQLGYYVQGLAAPNYDWWYGCSPTSAGMMMGYYDINGYLGLNYDNLVPGGVAEMNTYGNPGALVNGIIASPGHIADFYVGAYGASGDDVTPPFHSFDCLADFMGTSQDSVGNVNGGTLFYYYTDGSPLTASDIFSAGPTYYGSDGMYGVGEYLQYSGYTWYDPNAGVLTDDMLFTQLVDTLGLPYGFTFADFMAEIDAGRPVLVHIEGHTMLGYDYNAEQGTISVYDTWDPNGQNPGFMTWGGSYSGSAMWGVTVLEVAGGTSGGGQAIPEPATLTLVAVGLIAAAYRRRRR